MLRVCGITYVYTTNYGSCFQAYALKTAIEKIKVGKSQERCEYALIPLPIMKGYPRGKVKSIKHYVNNMVECLHRRQFNPFERTHMKYVPIKSFEQLDSLNEKADAFVCGSDVIWRPKYNLNLNAYYLDFAKKYKFSYAGSFGQREMENDKFNQIRQNFSSFDCISVREPFSAEIARQCTDKPIQIVPDPVLLLNKDDWEKIALSQRKKPYIFVYSTLIYSEVEDFVARLSKETGLSVERAVWGGGRALRQGVLQVHKPEEWLGLLLNAEYVVTNSFHATVFSSIFHTKFFTVVHGKIKEGANARMYDYLNEVGLSDRMFSSVPENIDLLEVDFKESDAIISRMRDEGIRFLQMNLDEAYRRKQVAEGKRDPSPEKV